MTEAATGRVIACGRSIAAPAAALVVAALLLARLMNREAAFTASHPGATFGSMSWPIAMVIGVIVSLALLVACRIATALGARKRDVAKPGPAEKDAGASQGRTAAIGIVAITLYVAAIPYIGFPLATLVFLVGWFVLAGTRKPVLVVVTSVLVTIGMLYMFVKVAYMPLPEGGAVFKQATVWMYRGLGIF